MITVDRREAWRLRAIEYILAGTGYHLDEEGGGGLVWIAPDSGRYVLSACTQEFTERFWPIRHWPRLALRREIIRFLR